MSQRSWLLVVGIFGGSMVSVDGVLSDTVYLRNGNFIDGTVERRDADGIELQVGTCGKLEIATADVLRVEKNERRGSDTATSVAGLRPDDGGSAARAERRRREFRRRLQAPVPSFRAEEDDQGGESDEDVESDEDGDFYEAIAPELKEKIESLVADLQRQRTRDRVRAERHLKSIGVPAVPFLLELSTHESGRVRVAVYRHFHRFGDDRVIGACVHALGDENEFVRDYANRALERITGEDFDFRPLASKSRRVEAATTWSQWWKKEQRDLEEMSESSGDR